MEKHLEESCLTQMSSHSPTQVDVSETFITIETKDGLSSEKIPFSQFLKKVIIDKESGNLKIDLGQLLAQNSSTNLLQAAAGNGSKSLSLDSIDQNTSNVLHLMSNNESKIASTSTTFDSQHLKQSEIFISDKPVKKRGRPRKQRSTDVSSPNTLNVTKLQNNTVHSLNSSKPCISSDTPTNPSRQDFTSALRRSSRTPAKNLRFGDDYVDSITFGKVSSSSSLSTPAWNTQLMTLALAAERHKNKPNKSNSSREKNYEKIDMVHEEGMHCDDSDYNPRSSDKDEDSSEAEVNTSEKFKQVSQKRFISVSDVEIHGNPGVKSEEKGKKVSIRGPKTLKKYEAVEPVVKRTLQEALIHVLETTKNHLCTTKPKADEHENTNTAAYYTIMEPKMASFGHGLLIEKSEEDVSFRIVKFDGALPSGLNQFSKSYPQDRFFSCDLCEKIFPSTSIWLQHNRYTHNRTINTFENLPHSSGNREEHVCQFCCQRFPYKFMLDIHIKRKRHSDVKSFRCTLCREGFTTHKDREEHWMMSHPARSCALCGKQFTNIVMLRRHINNNCHGARFRKRPDTEEMSAEDNMVISDLRVKSSVEDIHGNDSDEENLDITPRETEAEDEEDDNDEDYGCSKHFNEKVKCSTCGIEFSTYSGLWHHKLESHKEFYPERLKEILQDKLKRNQSMLLNAHETETQKFSDQNKNRFFVIMRPEWPPEKPNLTVSIEDKDFVFKSRTMSAKSITVDALPQNSYDDAPSQKETTFECVECGEIFQFASNYREHRSRVHGECFEILRLLGAFQCTLCSETYPCQFMLDKHMKRHVGKKILPCTLCGVYFHKIQDRRLHWKTVHPGIGCPNCGKMYASIKYLQKHISLNCQDHFPPTKKFLEFQKKQHSDFEMSKNEKKVEKKIIRCHLCPKMCSSIHGWRRHMSETHEDAGFSKLSNTCIICNELVYGYKALEKHLLQNHAEDSGLPVEEEEGLVEEALKKSEMDITMYRKAGASSTDIYQDEEGNYHCPSCSKTHTDVRALRTHIKTHINMKLECTICNKNFKNPTLLKQHVQRHRKDAVYMCDTCNKKFLTLQKLNKHRKVHHSSGNFVCELCGMSFALNDYLQKHKRCHSDKRPHCCTICGKNFRTKPELRVHVLIHTRETPYKCQYCNRGFSQRGNYRVHLAQHTGEKPYQCEQCDISFALLCHLKRHKITHDQKINYRCIWCEKECTQRKHMQLHVQRVHKEDFYQYEEQMKLETPVPIHPSQTKLYNRKLGKASKVRRQYRTRAQKCDATIQQLMNGVITKSEVLDEDMETSEDIVIEPMVDQMMKASHESGGYEILVSEDHQNYAKHTLSAELIGQDASNVEIVMGENNEINIIIKDPSALRDVVGDHLEVGSVQIHDSLQQAVEAFVHHNSHVQDEEGHDALGIEDLDKST